MQIALVISDVDGTLVTTDKRLTPATIAAVRRLGEAGIGFALASSRPPVGLKGLVADLGLSLPLGAFNGTTVVGPDLAPISQVTIPAEAAREAAERLRDAGIDLWVFARGAWHLSDADAPYVDLERRTLGVGPVVVSDLAPLLDEAQKIVGVSAEAGRLADLESQLAAGLDGRATVHRSQPYYLDVTPPAIDKGSFVDAMAERLGISRHAIATLGDAANDVAMFARSGFSVAMGNADPEVQRAASAVTRGNDEDGFAWAIERFVLPRGRA